MKHKSVVMSILIYTLVISCFVAATYWGSAAVTTMSQKIPLKREHTIIIDAGHGGVDGGATSCTGVLESEINLEIALKLNDLMHLLGYKTTMIRTTDCSIYTKGETIAAKKISDLKERVRIVNETQNGILVSIHQNTFSDTRYSGAQVFFPPTEGSIELAKAMQNALCETLNPTSNRKSKKASGVYLMDHIKCPGVLIECGFLSNPQEEAKLRDPQYQRNLCCVIGSCLSEFLTQ